MDSVADICEVNAGRPASFAFEAVRDGTKVGEIEVRRHGGRVRGLVAWWVRVVAVHKPYERMGIASALYAAAISEARRRRGHLASLGHRVDATTALWEKLVQAGRATRHELRPLGLPRRTIYIAKS